jgi:uncharacterized protein YceK
MTNTTAKLRAARLLPLLLVLSGCGTLKTKGNQEWGHTYSGTKCAVETARWVRRDDWALTPFALPDVLFSAVADTVVAPFDLMSSTHPAHANCDTGVGAKTCEFGVEPSSASIFANVDGGRDRTIDFVVAGVDGSPRRFGRYGSCDDAVARVPPGEREFSIQVMFFNRGLGNLLLFRAGPYFADMKLKAAVEPGKKYRVNGEVRDKSCFVWLEDASTGTKASPEAGAAYAENRPDLLPPSVFGGLAKILPK